MLILDATTRSLEVLLGGAVTTNQLPIVASYVDVTTTTYVPGSSNTVTNGAAPVPVVAAPGASTQRQIKLLTVQNADTVGATVILRYNDNGTTRQVLKVTLAVNDTLVYTDGEGFRVIDTNGQMKTSGTGGSGTPGGSDKNIQYNNAGAFAGVANNATATNKYLQQVSSGTPSMAQVAEADLSLTDIATNNVSTSKHGFAPKAPNDATKYLDGTGAYTVPPAAAAALRVYLATNFS